jgi:hypothetical protein
VFALWRRSRAKSAVLVAALLGLATAPARAAVTFQSTGAKAGWTSIGIQHKGRVDEVATPTYKGSTALRMEQTFEGLSGYHSEVRLHEAQGPQGSEAYYGMALYLPPNWIFHPQNVTFQQWARGDVFASPWVLMYVENDEIKVGGSGGVRGVIAKITGMQGKWIRVVTHIKHHDSNGLFEVWVNGVKGFTQGGDVSPAPTAPIRWSVGMYCTRWREEQPRGLNPMVLFHDHQRVATTLEEADPASWTDGPGTTPPPSDAGAPDAGATEDPSDAATTETTPDAREASPDTAAAPEAGGASGSGAGGAMGGGAGGMGGRRPPSTKGGAGGSADPEPDGASPKAAASASGCGIAGGGRGGPAAIVAALLAAALVSRRRRR